MATEEIVIDSTAGTGVVLRVFNVETGHVFNFSTNVFEAFTAGVNQKLAMTELSASNKATGLSTYRTTLDFSRLYRAARAKQFSFDFYEGTAPAAGVQPFASVGQLIQCGRGSEYPINIPITLTAMQPNGFSVQFSAYCERAEQPVDLFSCASTPCTADAGTDRITANSHGLANGTPVCFLSLGTLPTGLTAGTVYYARNVLTHTFQVSETPTGGIVDISSAGTGPHFWDSPSLTLTLRELGTASTTFSKTLYLDSVVNNRFEGRYPDGATCVFFDGVIIQSTGHGLVYGQPIAFMSDIGGALPTGITEGRTYYVSTPILPNSFCLMQRGNPAASPETNGQVGYFTGTDSGTSRYFANTPLLKRGRQYQLTATLSLGGQTHTDVQDFSFGFSDEYQLNYLDFLTAIDFGSAKLTLINNTVNTVLNGINGTPGVKLHPVQSAYPAAKAGDAMTLTSATLLTISGYPDASAKINTIYNKLPSRAYLAGSTQVTGALELSDLIPPGDKTYWATTTPLIAGLTAGNAYTIQILDDVELNTWAFAGSPAGWVSMADPAYATRYAAGDLTLTVTADSGGFLQPQSLPPAVRVNGTRLRIRKRAGASPAPADQELHPRWRLSRSTAEPVTSLSLDALKQFVEVDTGLTIPEDGSVCDLSGGNVIRPATDLILLDTTVQSVVDDKTFVLVGGTNSFDNAFNGSLVLLFDVSASNAVDPNTATTWDKDTRTLRVLSTPLFTVAAGDRVQIMASEGSSYSPTGRYVVR